MGTLPRWCCLIIPTTWPPLDAQARRGSHVETVRGEIVTACFAYSIPMAEKQPTVFDWVNDFLNYVNRPYCVTRNHCGLTFQRVYRLEHALRSFFVFILCYLSTLPRVCKFYLTHLHGGL